MTDRTRAVLELRAQGLSLAQIAARLHWCRRTVVDELGAAVAALGARNTCNAVYLATVAGII